MVKFPNRLEQLLPPVAVSKVLDLLSQPAISNTVRETLHKVGLKDANPVGQMQDAWRQARGWIDSVLQRVMAQHQASPAAINATGQLFDQRWSSLPMDAVALQTLATACVNFYDQSQLEDFALRVGMQSTGAASAMYTCSAVSCLSLLAEADAFAGGIVVARTDGLRLPGSADIRAMLSSGRNPVIDVGAVNGVTESEWRSALSSSGRAVFLVSPNSLELEQSQAQRAAAISAAKANQCPVIEFALDVTQDPALASALSFPLLKDVLASGVDVLIIPLDGLLGGPTGALIAGRVDLVNSLRAAAQARGLMMHGAALAGAAAALGHNNEPEQARSSIAQMLLTSVDNLKERARRLAIQLNNTSKIAVAESTGRDLRLGPSPWDRYRLASHAVSITPRNGSSEQLAAELASGDQGPAVWVKIDNDRCLLDLRFVDPADDYKLVELLHGAPQPTP